MIRAEQLTAYDAASKEVERAAQILEAINVASLDGDDRTLLAELIKAARNLRAGLYHQAHQRYCHDRGL